MKEVLLPFCVYVYFLDLFNKVNFPFSLVVADGFSELCLASEAN